MLTDENQSTGSKGDFVRTPARAGAGRTMRARQTSTCANKHFRAVAPQRIRGHTTTKGSKNTDDTQWFKQRKEEEHGRKG